jgi:hypothetical protein
MMNMIQPFLYMKYELIPCGFISFSCSIVSLNDECAENNVGLKRSLNSISTDGQTG